jgi:hypothetical protein
MVSSKRLFSFGQPRYHAAHHVYSRGCRDCGMMLQIDWIRSCFLLNAGEAKRVRPRFFVTKQNASTV